MTFDQQLVDHFQAVSIDDDLKAVRTKAWDQFLELGLPSRHQEVYQYVKLRQLYEKKFKLASYSDRDVGLNISDISKELENRQSPQLKFPPNSLVFSNGHFLPDQSTLSVSLSGLVILPLSTAFRTYGAFLKNHWTKMMKEETDPFAILNGALHKNGLFIYLPPKLVLEEPVHIVSVIDSTEEGSESKLILPRIHLFAGAQSQISLVTKVVIRGGSSYSTDFINSCFDFTLEEAASVSLYQIKDNLSADLWYFDAIRATIKRNSFFKTVTTTTGAATVREDYKVALTGENGEASLNGVWNLSDKKECHTNVLIDHQAPHCRSTQLFKGVLDDMSRSSFEGKIYVHRAAQKTDAFQLNNNLILSDRANADSKPNLEIFADDVKASHGATVGQPNAEQMFYMKSRGFSTAEARKLIVGSFCQEVIDLIPSYAFKSGVLS